MKIATLLSAGSLVAVGAAGAVGVMTLVHAQPVAGADANAGHASIPTPAYVPAAYTQSAAKSYTVDGVHSGVVFRIMHAGAAPFYGMFTGLSGDLVVDMDNPEATRLNMAIDTSKVATGNDNRDDHLRSADFFNARQFPTATFTSTSVKAAGDGAADGAMQVTGDLTLLGVTKPVTATMTPTGEGQFRNSTRAGFETKLTFKRSDFGMTAYIDQGTLGDEIELIVFIEGIEQ